MDYSLPDSSVHGIPQPRILCGLLFPSPGDLPKPGIKPGSPALRVNSLPNEPCGKSYNLLAIPGSSLLTQSFPSPWSLPSLSLLIMLMALLVCFIIWTDYFSMCPVIHTKYMSLCLYWRKTSFLGGGAYVGFDCAVAFSKASPETMGKVQITLQATEKLALPYFGILGFRDTHFIF